MLEIKEMNEHVGIGQQIQTNDDGSVVLINVFTIDPADEDALLTAWSNDAEFMRAQPGYISTQMHKGIAGSSTYINYAIWENVESFRNAFSNPEFQKLLSEYPASAIASPHLFKKLAVPRYCVA
ncbi:MAG: antibiotic biosynthesis monooxygenase family protein [Gammaproteobacteria bacterium]